MPLQAQCVIIQPCTLFHGLANHRVLIQWCHKFQLSKSVQFDSSTTLECQEPSNYIRAFFFFPFYLALHDINSQSHNTAAALLAILPAHSEVTGLRELFTFPLTSTNHVQTEIAKSKTCPLAACRFKKKKKNPTHELNRSDAISVASLLLALTDFVTGISCVFMKLLGR